MLPSSLSLSLLALLLCLPPAVQGSKRNRESALASEDEYEVQMNSSEDLSWDDDTCSKEEPNREPTIYHWDAKESSQSTDEEADYDALAYAIEMDDFEKVAELMHRYDLPIDSGFQLTNRQISLLDRLQTFLRRKYLLVPKKIFMKNVIHRLSELNWDIKQVRKTNNRGILFDVLNVRVDPQVVIFFLAQPGLAFTACSQTGKTPMHLLPEMMKHWKNIALCKDLGMYQKPLIEALVRLCPRSLINAKDTEGNTALHLAIEADLKDLVKLLVEQGADLTVENEKMMQPLTLMPLKLSRVFYYQLEVMIHIFARSQTAYLASFLVTGQRDMNSVLFDVPNELITLITYLVHTLLLDRCYLALLKSEDELTEPQVEEVDDEIDDQAVAPIPPPVIQRTARKLFSSESEDEDIIWWKTK